MSELHVVVAPDAGPLAHHGEAELRELAARMWPDTTIDVRISAAPGGAATIVLGRTGDEHVRDALAALGASAEPTGADAFSLRTGEIDAASVAVVVGADDAGVLYGVYELLEACGARFYATGPSLPAPGPVALPTTDIDRAPLVRLRGVMPYTDFLTGPTTWDLADYRHFIDQAARLRLNLFSMHFYTFEPIGQFTFKGQPRTEAFWDTSRTTRWHKRPGRIADLAIGREHFAEYAAADTFGARSALVARTPEERFRFAEADVRAAFAHAKARGMRTTIGVEVTDPPLEFRALIDPADRFGPDGFGICPSSAGARELMTAWLRALVTTFPDVDTYSLWQTENGPSRWTAGCPCAECVDFRAKHPLPTYSVKDLLGEVSAQTYNVEDVTESAQMFLQWVLMGHEILAREAPGKQVALAGWYIEHLFRDAAPYLPEDLVLSSMTEVDPWEAPPLLDHYEGVDRERWLINWWEIDFRMWLPQPKVSAYPPILDKVRRYGIDGVIWQTWRTRSVDDNARYTALAMWDAELEPRDYYLDAFGVEWGAAAAAEAADAMLLFEEFERWLCHDLGWQVFAPDWSPPTVAQGLEFVGSHGGVPINVVRAVRDKLVKVPRIRERLHAVLAGLTRAEALAERLRAGDRPGFWRHRVEFYLLYIDCLEHAGKATLAYDDAWRDGAPMWSGLPDLKRTYEHLRAAPVREFIQKLADRVEDKGDLGTLLNLNNELWSRYRDALDNTARWFDEAAVGGMWLLRVRPDGTLRPPLVGPDALLPEGQWA